VPNKPPGDRPMSQFTITEERVQQAFDVLESGDHSKWRAAYSFGVSQLKVTLAKAAAMSNAKTISERDSEALRSTEYAMALTDLRKVEEGYHRARDKRDAAHAIIEAWRTQQSDRRAMGKVG
jgi:hypothetical protein